MNDTINTAAAGAVSGDPFDLERFVQAQAGIYDRALAELRRGRKESHWMWFLFPQFERDGLSMMSQRYAIHSRAEAEAYLRHPVLGPRLLECAGAVAASGESDISLYFGYPDDLKLNSCATLFAALENAPPVFEQVLQKYYGGARDADTLARLAEIASP